MNKFIIHRNYAEIIIESPKYGTFFSKIDLNIVSFCKKHLWGINKVKKSKDTFYVINNKIGLLHRIIMKAKKGEEVDHKYGDTLDNRRKKLKLRFATRSQNMHNRKLQKNNTSGYAGISWVNKHQKWMAHIRVNDHHKTLGYFDDIKKAIKEREKAEKKYFKEFRRENK